MPDRELRLLLDDEDTVIVAAKGNILSASYNAERTRLRVKAIPGPVTPPPDPTPDPTPGARVTDVGFVTVQKEVDGTRALIKATPWALSAQHMHSFGSNCDGTTDAGGLLDKSGARGWLYAGMSTSDIDVNGENGCTTPDNSRPKDAASCVLHAQRCWDVLRTRPGIIGVTFWQEMKGYGTNGTLFSSHAIPFATELRRLGFKGYIAGPYTTGGYSDAENTQVHQTFIDLVVKPHPELFDAVAWDASDGSKAGMYLDIYRRNGLEKLPHINTENYPGGWQPTSSTTRATAADVARSWCGQAAAGVRWIMNWSTGGGGEDKSQKAWVVNGNGTPNSLWADIDGKIVPFLQGGDVSKSGTDRWTNGKGTTLSIVGPSVILS